MDLLCRVETGLLHAHYLRCRTVRIDSRLCEQGDMFFALRGQTDGNAFVRDALARGATHAVVDDPALQNAEGCLWVPDVLTALQDLARHHRRHLGLSVLALTGSNGKTTTKELLFHALSCKYRTWATPGNLNNHIGVPLTLLGIPASTEFAVCEMGASACGEIAGLCAIAEPDYGLITNIGLAHLEGFGGAEGVRRGKGELYDFLKAGGKTIFYLADEDPLPEMVGDYPHVVPIRSGDRPAAGVVQLKRTDPGIELAFVDGEGKTCTLTSPLFGIHNARNILYALAVGLYFGIEGQRLADALSAYVPVNNRSQRRQVGSTTLILDAYNANPGSMAAAIKSLAALDSPHRLAVLGDMLELGHEAARQHQDVIDMLRAAGIPAVLVGPLFAATDHPAEWPSFADSASAAGWLRTQDLSGRTLLIKGSRGMRMEGTVAHLLEGTD